MPQPLTLETLVNHWPSKPEEMLKSLGLLIKNRKFTPNDFKTAIAAGELAGLTILCAIAYQAPHAFLALLKKYPQITPVMLAERTPKGPHQGKSVITILAGKTKNLDIFLALCESYPKIITPENFLTVSSEKEHTGLSLLCVIAQQAPASLITLREKYPEWISAAALSARVPEGPHQDKSALWFLASNDNPEHSDAFIKICKSCPQAITEEVLTTSPQAMPGMTILWMQAKKLAKQKLNAFNEVFAIQPKAFTAKTLSTLAQSSHHQKNVLWFLAAVAYEQSTRSNPLPQPTLFVQVLEYCPYPQAIPEKSLTICPQEGSNKDKSMLWFAAAAAAQGNFQPLLKILSLWPNLITKKILATQFKTRTEGENSLLWILAAATAQRYPEAFLALLNACPQAISKKLLMAPATTGTHQGRSALYFLANAAARGYPEAFSQILTLYPQIITVDILTQSHGQDPAKRKSIIWFLSYAVAQGYPTAFLQLLISCPQVITVELLCHHPHGNQPPYKLLSSIKYPNRQTHEIQQRLIELFTQDHNPKENIEILKKLKLSWSQEMIDDLLTHKETFLTNLKTFANNKNTTPSQTELSLKNLKRLAQSAENYGYLNAFYDLGITLEARRSDQAFECYKRVPERSPLYHKALFKLANGYYLKARVLKSTAKKNALEEALIYATKLPNYKDRQGLIHAINELHVQEETKSLQDKIDSLTETNAELKETLQKVLKDLAEITATKESTKSHSPAITESVQILVSLEQEQSASSSEPLLFTGKKRKRDSQIKNSGKKGAGIIHSKPKHKHLLQP